MSESYLFSETNDTTKNTINLIEPNNEKNFSNDQLAASFDVKNEKIKFIDQLEQFDCNQTPKKKDSTLKNKLLFDSRQHEAEPSLIFFFQVLFPFLIAGIGMVLAGIVFNIVQFWKLFKEVPETLILVPALLGLKGNLEMTLASRLSTLSNLGDLDSLQQVKKTVIANVALIQTQAIVVTFFATISAIVMAWIPRGNINWNHALLLCVSSLTTSSIASLFLSGIMIGVVLLSRKYNINPDNITTPIAASLGDLTTLLTLSTTGSFFLHYNLNTLWFNFCIIGFFFGLIFFFSSTAFKNLNTREALIDGWSPIVFSMLISSSGGFVLEQAMRSYHQMPLFQLVINGVGGNLAAIHASRLSTFFHKVSVLGVLPYDWSLKRFFNFHRAFFSKDWDARSARVLLSLVVPGHLLFNWLIKLLHAGKIPSTGALFISVYLIAALAQVTLLLYFCQWLVAILWKNHINPDNSAIPYLTALGDLIGTIFLYCAFLVLNYV